MDSNILVQIISIYCSNHKNLCRGYVLTDEESGLIWQPVIEFRELMEFEGTPMLGDTDSSTSVVFPLNQNRFAAYNFQLTFSCDFNFAEFPFDHHDCPMEYGDGFFGQQYMTFNITMATFSNKSTKSGGDPIIMDKFPFPFEFQLVSLPIFERRKIYMATTFTYSYTGILLKMRRKSLGQLLCGFFYPTAAFALLSMISFLIKPDVVRLFVMNLFKL